MKKLGGIAKIGDELRNGFSAKALDAAFSVRVEMLDESPEQLRIDINNIEELAQSIKNIGFVQPITVCENENGRYTIISGHRRVCAAKYLGLETIPANKQSIADKKELSLKGLVENIQREDMNAYETALAVDKALAVSGKGVAEFCSTIGKSAAWLSKIRRVLNLPPAICEQLAKLELKERKKLGVDTLAELSRIQGEDIQKAFFERLKSGDLNRETFREEVRRKKTESSLCAHTEPKTAQIGVFWKKSEHLNTVYLLFDFEAFTGDKKASFLSDIENILTKYAKMTR